MNEITNYKHQITKLVPRFLRDKFQITNLKLQTRDCFSFVILVIGFCDLLGICDLLFVISYYIHCFTACSCIHAVMQPCDYFSLIFNL
jgi:hypothetical protein